ncbi:SAM-dependent methyltransferase [Nocardiopsis sp. L17-MgMaSL7]|uniref:SAM-dependent methyltransferase n=1 Tax=Nocardiopsis sp. L17-MgMaSL7 TaxID=1938893 RepID=UPI000D71BBFD|nr:SAM-dependent methyltransferase [Nocardiopsis sp. L17-MgMaSL7]PWV46751.1 S-adenosyl methyltransferase [Nocardiopsis sp. L17-MgMaSL7]
MNAHVPEIDTTKAHSARVWNYWQGGKDNYPVDREVGDYVLRAHPEMVGAARADRQFLIRAVTHLADACGVRQFLDIGTGLPTHNNTHEVAHAVAPDARVVYVDNDPMVLAHARALLTGEALSEVHYVDADLHQPAAVLSAAREHLDFSEPIGLTILGTMGHTPDTEQAYAAVRAYVDALPSGSFLALCDGTDTSEPMVEAAQRWNETAAIPYHLRSPKEIEGFFAGLELLEPGVVSAPFWRPAKAEVGEATEVDQYCGVARKP